jgi:hypothetical protein
MIVMPEIDIELDVWIFIESHIGMKLSFYKLLQGASIIIELVFWA